MRLIELFAGVGSQTQALKNIGVEHEVIGISEIDKFAIASYEALHGPTHNFGDISCIPKLPEVDLWTYSFPCQDLSVAGKQAGLQGQRSGLLYEVERLLTTSPKPKYLLMENVKNLVGKQHRADFEDWIARLEEFGYANFWQVLNAKDYGIPQNRERVFMISILGGGNYTFPETQPLALRLKDLLEDNVDTKYYLDVSYTPRTTNISGEIKMIGKLDMRGSQQIRRLYDPDGLAPTLDTMQGGNRQPKIIVAANTNSKHEQSGRVYDPDGLSPTIMSNSHGKTNGGYTAPKIITHHITQKVKVRKFEVDVVKLQHTLRQHKNKTNKEIATQLNKPLTLVEHWFRTDTSFSIPTPDVWFELKELLGIATNEFDESIITFEEKDNVFDKSNRVYDTEGLSPTLTASNPDEKILEDTRIRKLTPKECWRLMGFTDEQFDKVSFQSNTQLYKQAGNSIVVPVLEALFKELI